jgi:Tfp pilus assembly ATPase PilU
MEQGCGPLAVEIFPGNQENTAISAHILSREQELSLSHAQSCNFLIMEPCCGRLAVENFQESTVTSAHILPRD